jgi:hypothetical protein
MAHDSVAKLISWRMPVPESVSPDVVSLGGQAPATDDLSDPDLTSRVRNSGAQPAAKYSGDLLGKLNTRKSSYTSPQGRSDSARFVVALDTSPTRLGLSVRIPGPVPAICLLFMSNSRIVVLSPLDLRVSFTPTLSSLGTPTLLTPRAG